MKEKLFALWAKVVENKTTVIRVGGAVAGALVGVMLTGMMSNEPQDELIDVLEEVEE